MLIDKALELVDLAREHRVVVDLGDAQRVHHDAIQINLAQEVGLPQVGPRDFVVLWDEVALAEAADSHVDVFDAAVAVHEHNVLVHDPDVVDGDRKLDQERYEEADCA